MRGLHGDPAGVVRLVTWNLNHRNRARAIPFAVLQVIHALAPDVVAFTEYVPGPSHFVLLEGLASLGLRHHALSEGIPRENRILLGSRSPMSRGGVRPPPLAPAAPSNVMHARLIVPGIDVVAVRIPDYSRAPATKRALWDWLEGVARAGPRLPAVIIGDFNTDLHYPRARCGERPERLVQGGWRMVIPLNTFSFWTPRGDPVRIDHAYLSPGLDLRSARYVTAIDGFVLVTPGGGALSDHAALVVDVDLVGAPVAGSRPRVYDPGRPHPCDRKGDRSPPDRGDAMDFDLANAEEVLRRTPLSLDQLLRGLPTQWTERNEGGDTWSPFDVVGHLIDGEETDWIRRARVILSDAPQRCFEPFDRYRHLARNCGRTLESLLDEFAELRRASLRELASLAIRPEDLARTGEHPALGEVTLGQLLATWVAHDLGHVAQIARVMAKQYAEAVGPWREYIPILGAARTDAVPSSSSKGPGSSRDR